MINKRMIPAAMFNICSLLCAVIDVLADVSEGVIVSMLVDVLDINKCVG